MSNKLKLSVSPHIHSGQSTAGIMRDVLISLLPATIAGTVIFGLRSLLVVAVCIAACVGFEALFNFIIKKDQTIGDFSAAVTGLLLALNLPANIPLWQCVIGALFAIVVVKCLFGGIGCNPVNGSIRRIAAPLSILNLSIGRIRANKKVENTMDSLIVSDHIQKLLFNIVHKPLVGRICFSPLVRVSGFFHKRPGIGINLFNSGKIFRNSISDCIVHMIHIPLWFLLIIQKWHEKCNQRTY